MCADRLTGCVSRRPCRGSGVWIVPLTIDSYRRTICEQWISIYKLYNILGVLSCEYAFDIYIQIHCLYLNTWVYIYLVVSIVTVSCHDFSQFLPAVDSHIGCMLAYRPTIWVYCQRNNSHTWTPERSSQHASSQPVRTHRLRTAGCCRSWHPIVIDWACCQWRSLRLALQAEQQKPSVQQHAVYTQKHSEFHSRYASIQLIYSRQ